ncbi:hypothetical protein [Filobacillus milosensis]|uniref:hypothetical protein n=1 Tax=Filobacillus milosensis TaxID=94137 RepID=UPI00129BDD17|nr:hypothetical protein [Filobacillus milosensis]
MNKTSHHFYRDLACKDFQPVESKSALIEFQSQYKYLFMAYHPGKQQIQTIFHLRRF